MTKAADRENVIKGLEGLRDVCNDKSDMAIGKGRTAWAGYASVVHLALDLLRDQEPVEPQVNHDIDGDSWYYRCGKCHEAIDYKERFCRRCGREVKWDG